jgi:alkaline phosphatase D
MQTGDVTDTAALVSLRTSEPVLELVVVRGTEDGWEEVGRFAGLLPEDGVLQTELVDLVPDTTYMLAAYAEDGVRRTPEARLRTALYPGVDRVVRFGATSCLGGNEPWPTLSHLAAEQLDFFVFLGDTIYADAGLAPAGDWDDKWAEALRVEGMLELTASTSVVATWDDHEVDNDWSWDDDDMPGKAFEALRAFRRSLPQREGPGGSGLWRSLRWGDVVELFVLDCRGERLGGDYVSPEQLQWLQDGLVASPARFKIIVNSVPITDMDDVYFGLGASDRWDGYPEQRTAILDFIEAQPIEGVLWLAGDFHWGALSTIGRPGDPHDGQREVFCGPGGSLINPVAFVVPEGDHYELVVREYNSVLFEADPAAGTIRVVFVGDGGGVIAERTLSL